MLEVFIYLILYAANVARADIENQINADVIKTEHYVIWPNGVIPFYIEPEHFDHEQSLAIMTTLSLFAFRTCLKFNPVLVRPTNTQHVLLFENPNGVRKCVFGTEGHLPEGPHKITLGYGCMKSPQIDMMVMRALGFSFEHNRASRDLFIDVQFENIDPSAVELFTKESKLPPELRPLRYDVNSVTHFGEREFSKNGHRTIIFKDHNVKQNRIGLSDLDIRKIEIVYGPECLTRERKEKIELCQNYPGVARRKREAMVPVNVTNLRVNRGITPPPEVMNETEKAGEVVETTLTTKVAVSENETNPLAELGIEKDAKEIVDRMDRLSSTAFKNARVKYCNDSEKYLKEEQSKVSDLLGTSELLKKYARTIISHADQDTESFCGALDTVDKYIARCGFDDYRCRQYFRSTQSRYRWSTQNLPPHNPYTKHPNRGNLYDPISRRNNSEAKVRRKRESTISTMEPKVEDKKDEVKDNKVKVNNDKKETKVNETKTDTSMALKTVTVNSNSTLLTKKKLTEGRRRFKDSPFSVYRRKKDDKEGAFVSDVSMEKHKKRFKKIQSQSKHHKSHKKERKGDDRRGHTRDEPDTRKGRNKREIPPSSIKPDDVKNIADKGGSLAEKHPVEITPDQGTSGSVAGTTPAKIYKKRRFEDSPFSVFEKKKHDKGDAYASDVSLEVPKKNMKKSKSMKKKMEEIKKSHNSERIGDAPTNIRKKRNITPDKSSAKPEANGNHNRKEAKADMPPVHHANQADHNTSVKIANETMIHGIRRFKDSPFSVYKMKKNEKKYMYASDLSLENNEEKKNRRFIQTKKRSSFSKRKGNGADPRGEGEFGKVRGKREAELDRSSIEVIEDGGRQVIIEKAELAEGNKDENETVMAKRRFKVVSFGPDNMNDAKNMYTSDLSLESKPEIVFKGSKTIPKMSASHGKKKRSKARSMEAKILSAEQPATRPVFKTVKLTKKNEEFYADRKWPDGVVRYVIKDIPKYDIDDVRYRLEEVNKILKEKTCVYLMEIKKEDRSLYEDYLLLDNTPDYVTGRVGGKQHFGVVELFEGGQHRQHAAMVVMSMLGFYFEPSRHDRDRYIRVHPRHIRADKLHHFEPLRPDATLPLPYDYKSATHPPWQFWRHIGKTGISSLATYKDQDPNGSIMKSLGHHAKLLSDLDIVKINSVYGIRCLRENVKSERTI